MKRRVFALLAAFLFTLGCTTTREVTSFVHARSGDRHFEQKRYDAAIDAFREAQKADPRSLTPRLRVVNVYIALGRNAEAVTELQRALQMLESQAKQRQETVSVQDRAEVYFLLGRSLEGMGQLKEAISHYERSRFFAPSRKDYSLALMSAYVKSGRLDEATKTFSQDKDFVAPLLLLGLSHLKDRDFKRAAIDFETLRRQTGDLPAVRALEAFTALALIEPGSKSEGEKVISEAEDHLRAAKELGDNVLVLYGLARIGEIRGMAGANEHYAAARQSRFTMDKRTQSFIDASELHEAIQSKVDEIQGEARNQASMGYQRTVTALNPDKRDPEITLDEEVLAGVTNYSFAIVSGIATDDGTIASVEVNGRAARVQRAQEVPAKPWQQDKVEFVARVNLDVGENSILVKATDATGKSTTKSRRVIREFPSYPFKQDRRWALFVSVRQYGDDPKVPRRPGGAVAPKIIERLSEGIQPSHVERLIDERGTRENLLQALLTLSKIPADQAEEVLIYLDLWVRVLPAGKNELGFYFLPYDARADDLLTSSIGVSELSRILQQIPARRVVVLLNTSHVGRSFENDPFVKQPGRIILGAAREQAFSSSRLAGSSIFLFHIAEAIDQTLLERSSLSLGQSKRSTSLWDVFERVASSVVTFTSSDQEPSSRQKPSSYQEPVWYGDKESARQFLLAGEERAKENLLLERLTNLALEGQLGREQLIRAVSPIFSGFTDSDSEIRAVLSRFAEKRITDKDLGQQLLSPRVVGK